MGRKKDDEFDPMAVRGGKMAAAGDDTGVTISLPGHEAVHTTIGGIKEAAGAAEARVNGIAAAELRQFIERIERLEEEKTAIVGDIKDVFGESKGRGFDSKAIRTIIKMRKQDRSKRLEEQAILDTYLAALGME